MTTHTTTTLIITPWNRMRLWLRWYHQRLLYGLVGLAWLITLVLIARTLQGPHSAARAVPTPALPITSAPIVVIQRAPTLVPVPTATPDGRVLEELAALREQVAQLQAAQAAQPAPQVVYQVVNQPEQAAPTVDSAQYQIDNQPPAPTLAPQQAAILDRNAWAAQAQQHKEQP